jgi:N-acetyl-gamma-glutamyl-phosphate reductase
VYGLPELHRKAIAGTSLVASPGCYSMGAILATAPLVKHGLARLDGIVIDGKSGVTGAGAQGRKIDPMYLFTEANENLQAYAIASHRHTPEIEQELSALAGTPVRVSFTPHLVPLNRGLLTTASVPLASALATADLLRVYRDFYAGESFVRVLGEGERPSTRHVTGSNYCDVTVVADPRTGRAVCVSAIDNLGKGGSANGVQNLNVLFGWNERTGLDAPPVYP